MIAFDFTDISSFTSNSKSKITNETSKSTDKMYKNSEDGKIFHNKNQLTPQAG